MRAALAAAAPAILIALVVLLPFLGKAYTIDDVTFLLQAKHTLTDPFHPTAFEMVFHGERIRLSRDLVSGPVMAYLLLPSVMSGGDEWIAHAVQAALLVLAAASTASLAHRLGQSHSQGRIAALLVVLSPAVLAMASTAMPDVPCMAFAIAGTERLFAARQERSALAAWAGALLLGLAALARPHAILILPCVLVLVTDADALRRGARAVLRDWRDPLVLMIAVGLIVWGAVILLTRDPLSGETVARTSVRRFDVANASFNLTSFLVHWAVAFPLALVWPVIRGPSFLSVRRGLVCFSIAMLFALLGNFLRFGLIYGTLGVILAAHALNVLLDIGVVAWRARDPRALGLFLWLLIGAVSVGYVHLPAKVLVPSAPAMALLITWQLGRSTAPARMKKFVTAALAPCLLLGVLILRADDALAEVGREGGRVVAHHRARAERVWFDGGWGFQWYAMQAGGMPLADSAPFPSAGDIVVLGPTARIVKASYPDRRRLERHVYDEPGGRLFHDGAGFYENLTGPLPWRWGSDLVGLVEAWRLGPVRGTR